MLTFYKTQEGRMQQLSACEPGCWVHCVAPTDDEVSRLIDHLKIEPDFFRAALDEEESPHIDQEDACTLIMVDIPTVLKEEDGLTYSTRPLGLILTEKNVVTVSLYENPLFDEFADGAVKDVQTNLKTRFVLQWMLRIASRYLLYLKQIDRTSDQLEEEVRKSMKNNELIRLLNIEKSLMYFSSSLKQNEITLEKIMRGRAVKLYDEDQDLLEDVLIEVKQAIDMANIHLNVLSGTMDAFASLINNNMNNVMKILASITLIISIPTVDSGIWGMNVGNLPSENFWVPILVTILAMIVSAVVLRRKNMI